MGRAVVLDCGSADHQILTHELRDGYFVETRRFTGGQANLTYGGVNVPVEVGELLTRALAALVSRVGFWHARLPRCLI